MLTSNNFKLYHYDPNGKVMSMSDQEKQQLTQPENTAPEHRNGKVLPLDPVDAHEKGKNYLTAAEVDLLIKGAKKSRYPARNALLILMMFRHGLRVTEATSMKMSAVNFKEARLWVNRLKGSLSTEHPIRGDEIRAIKRYLATRNDRMPWLFTSNQNQPMTRQNVRSIIATAAKVSDLPPVNPHMLRHSCGFHLANKGVDTRLIQDFLGHRNIQHTAAYTRTASTRFETLWD